MSITVSGAYGRDYKSKAEILTDWNAGKDFTNRSMSGGAYVNKEDAKQFGMNTMTVRYKADRSVCILTLKNGEWK